MCFRTDIRYTTENELSNRFTRELEELLFTFLPEEVFLDVRESHCESELFSDAFLDCFLEDFLFELRDLLKDRNLNELELILDIEEVEEYFEYELEDFIKQQRHLRDKSPSVVAEQFINQRLNKSYWDKVDLTLVLTDEYIYKLADLV